MKIHIYITILLSGLVLAGCYEDKGNYDYQDAEDLAPVILSTFEENYDLITLDQLVLEPEMQGDADNYDYLWYAYPSQLATEPIDTLGYEKNLDYNMVLAPGNYTLIFKATDMTNGASAYLNTELTVSSPFGVGYYVNKYEDGQTDVDFIDRDGVVNASILQQINGESLDGEPISSTYFSVGYTYVVEDEEGNSTRYSSEPGYIVCSDEDLKIYHGETMEELADFESAFLEAPEVKKPQGLAVSAVGYMLINDGSPHMLFTNSQGFGKFGYPLPNRNYDFSKYVINTTTSFTGFDKNAGQFLVYSSSKNEAITDATYSDYDLAFLAAQPYYLYISYNSFALLKHKTENKALIVQLNSIYLASSYFLYTEYVVPQDMDVLDASVFAIGGGNSVLYYSDGDNKVGYYNFSNQTQQDMITLPEDEKVVYMQNVYDLAYGPNLLMVLTDKGGSWNLHVFGFEGSTPDVDLSTQVTYSGTGTPSTVTYRDGNTYVTY